MTDKQPVAEETEVSALPETAAETRTDNGLDDLLSQYDQETTQASPPETKPQPDLTAEVQTLKAQVQSWAEEKNKQAIAETVKAVRGDIPPELYDDEFVEGWLDVQARKDPRLAQAFVQREQKPGEWRKVQQELHKRLQTKAEGFQKLPDKGATETKEIVAAAVRGASAKVAASPPPKLGNLSDAELRKHYLEMGINPGF